MFGFGGSEKLDAAKVPKITDAVTGETNGHNTISGKILRSIDT